MLGVFGRTVRWQCSRTISVSREGKGWGYLNTVSGGGGHDLQGVRFDSGSASPHGSSVLA